MRREETELGRWEKRLCLEEMSRSYGSGRGGMGAEGVEAKRDHEEEVGSRGERL